MKQMLRLLMAVCISLLIAISPVFISSPAAAAEGESALGAETDSASVLVTAVIEAPDDPDDPDVPDDQPDHPTAKTGDQSKIGLYVRLLLLSSAGIIILCVCKLRR